MKNSRHLQFSFFLLFSLIAFLFVYPFFSSYQYTEIHLTSSNHSPSFQHPFGTDDLGRDLLVRVAKGFQVSFMIALLAAMADLFIGLIYGAFSAYSSKRVDGFLMRICDFLYSIPAILIVLVLSVFIGTGFFSVILVTSALGWVQMARMIRGHLLELREADYIMAAKIMGASPKRILFIYLLPSLLGTILVTLISTMLHAIFTESFLSFLGLGIQPPLPSLGLLLSDALSTFSLFPWRLFFPAFVLVLFILFITILGNILRDFFDPSTLQKRNN